MGRNHQKAEINEQNYGISRYFLLVFTLSFLGWAFETVYMWLAFGKLYDRGFMTLPVCPIYGVSLFVMYLIAGTPDEGRFLLKKVDNRAFRYLFYLLIAFIVPSVAEFLVGFVFDKAFDTWLWNYSSLPLNVNGYVCLPVSFVWAALIFVFMKFVFTPIKNLIGKLPIAAARILATLLLLASVVDIVYNFSHLS